MKFLIAILPVVAQYVFEAFKEWLHERKGQRTKSRIKDMKDALKDNDIKRVNYLFNRVRDKNRSRKKSH